jgi:nicotinate-nucleotide adenylyltransferase
MRVGLYFGSFNPLHVGHIQVARYFQNIHIFDAIWFVPSPLNPHKSEETLGPAELRLSWVKTALESEEGLSCCDIEFGLGLPSYTHRTVVALKAQHPEHTFSLIMGADNLIHFHKWNHAEELAAICPLFVYARPGYNKPQEPIPFGATWHDAPLLHISATEIRDKLANNEDIGNLVPSSILAEVEAFFQHFFAEQDQ